ncbi:lysoplasmalogenase [Aestuariibacter halophilus]|uniref:Lysoplasmalogenase n=1 Tax=Fluctibacter halophilus TaxID=226011 RepID=A0ABS8GDU4_9ALTE|nr:lysoplasmalogenase [Aestuariibacter halophilus]MCC2617964.1 lysoplasmalogenase [Aestuariibacter halophilus]
MSQQRFLALYALLALSYLFVMGTGQYPLHYLHKAAPVLMLLWMVWRAGAHWLGAGLAVLLSATGDILLALPLASSFMLGLSAFLLAHLAYMAVLWPMADRQRWRHPALIALFPALIGMAFWVLPSTGELMLPVAVYMLVLSIMAITAMLVPAQQPWLLAGAWLFVVSDACIAINKFTLPFAASGWVIMVTYYLAQYCLIRGICAHASRSR